MWGGEPGNQLAWQSDANLAPLSCSMDAIDRLEADSKEREGRRQPGSIRHIICAYERESKDQAAED